MTTVGARFSSRDHLEEAVNFMDDDPILGRDLKPVELADRAVLDPYFASLSEPLSDYTFSQLFTWRNSLRILWTRLHGHLCVFANGSGDLTLLMPPIGDTGSDAALAQSIELMDEYNFSHNVPQRTRIEYASEELLARFDQRNLVVEPMGADYVYDVNRMIDLAGGDLASKRQAKNRFTRLYDFRVEPYRSAGHLDACEMLLENWKIHQDAQHLDDPTTHCLKRNKESIATSLCLRHAEELGLRGLVIHAKARDSAGPMSVRGFTFGERLGTSQSSITIEKTDLETKGLAQFIFSEFCRTHWSDRPLVNVGDDWGLPTLAWTKLSYRPVKMLQKFVMRPAGRVSMNVSLNVEIPPGHAVSTSCGAPTRRAFEPVISG
jgi:hypothetical protein